MKVHPITSLVGSFVEIVTIQTIAIMNETEEGRFEKKHPLTITGYLLDIDEEWLYLGTAQGDITDYIRKKRIIHVGSVKPVDELDNMLDETPEPTDNEKYN